MLSRKWAVLASVVAVGVVIVVVALKRQSDEDLVVFASPAPPSRDLWTVPVFAGGNETVHAKNETVHVVPPTTEAAMVGLPSTPAVLPCADTTTAQARELLNGVKQSLSHGDFASHADSSEVGVTTMITMDKVLCPIPGCNEALADEWKAKYYKDGVFTSGISTNDKAAAKRAHYWQEAVPEMVFAASKALWAAGFPVSVASGTLLGWYRQCGAVEYTTDVDMMIDHAVFETKADSDRFLQVMNDAGFETRKLFSDWFLPGYEMSFYYKYGRSKIKMDIFTVGWEGDLGFSHYFKKDYHLRCYFPIAGWSMVTWGDQVVSATHDPETYLAGIYGEAWKVPPKVYKGAEECYRHDGTACDAYSDACPEPERRLPVLHATARYLERARQSHGLILVPLLATSASALEGPESTVELFTLDFGVAEADKETWRAFLGATDRRAGLSTFDVVYEADSVEHHRSAEVRGRPANQPRPFVEVFFSINNPVSVRLWTLVPTVEGVEVPGLGLTLPAAEIDAAADCQFGDLQLRQCVPDQQ